VAKSKSSITAGQTDDLREPFAMIPESVFSYWDSDYRSDLTPAAFMVYTAIVFRAQRRKCFPSIQYIADRTGLNRDTVSTSLQRLEREGLIGIERRYNERGQTSSMYTIITVPYAEKSGMAIKRDAEKSDSPPSEKLGTNQINVNQSVSNETLSATQTKKPAKQEKPKTTPKATKGTRIPDSFQITDELRKWAIAEGATAVQVERETAKFVDYWSAVPGARGVKLDWIATWRNWIRRNLEDHRTGYAGGGNGHASDTVYGTDELQAVYRAQGQEQREYEPIPLVKPNRRNTPASSGNGRVDSHNGPQRTKGT
jgi:predicted transcriptional regulator